MLSENIKRPTTEERKAFHYFGFDAIVPFKHVKDRIDELKEHAEDGKLAERILEHAEHIESYFDDQEMRNDETIFKGFNKDKRRKKWESYKKDFKGFEFSTEVAIEPVEEETIESADEELVDAVEPTEDESGEIEVAEEESIEVVNEDESGEIEAADEETDEIETAEEGSIEVVNEDGSGEIEVVRIEPKPNQTKIYINGELLGYCEDPENFTQEMREKRRNGEVSHEMNIT